MSLEEESNPWKETKCIRLATAGCTTDSSVEENLRPAGRWACSIPWRRGASWSPGNGATGVNAEPCDLRWTRKEGTDVGWRLRADLHHEGDPGACYPGVVCRDPVYSLFRNATEESQVFRDGGRQGAQGGPVRARQCTPGEVLRSSRPSGRVRPSSRAGGRWPGATLRPRESRETPPLVGLVEGTGPAPRVPKKRSTRAMMEGGNSYPSCNEQARSVRDA